MPGSVHNNIISEVLPHTLCESFGEAREFRASNVEYPDGSGQRLVDATVSRKQFSLTKRLNEPQVAALMAFYLARKGGAEPFYFYFVLETMPPLSHDPTGQNPTGRYSVRFEGDCTLELGVGRLAATICLIEVA